MKRLLVIVVLAMGIYACDKETDTAYDTHLFQQLQAQNWVLDSARITDSTGRDSSVRGTDTSEQITQFNSQQYYVSTVRLRDSMVLDSISYQIIYDNPSRMYFYDAVSQQVLRGQYLDIDSVNTDLLWLTKTDTLNTITRSYYHAK